MNKRQKALLVESITIIVITAVAVLAMINLKDWVSRSEAVQSMEQLGRIVLQYRKEHGSAPPEDYIKSIKEKLEGHVGLGKLQYRARWIDFESKPDEILAYTEKKHRASLLSDGYVVLRLDGRVEWMDEQEFQKLLGQQRRKSPQEVQMLEE
ncbi:MAG: hypothetical protein ACETVZ_00400 [Phycisphaerae bacterium]